MKNLNLKLLTVLILASIGAFLSIGNVKITKKANDEVLREVEEFYRLTYPFYREQEKFRLKVGFGNLNKSTLGICRETLGELSIIIDEKQWEKSSKTRKKVIVFHEMGHCICKLDHIHFLGRYPKLSDSITENIPKDVSHTRSGFFPDYCPTTIMHPAILPDFCFERYEHHYKYELLLRCAGGNRELR